MKKFAGVVAALAFVTPTYATDLPARAPVYKAAPIAAYDWTGWYGGFNVGLGSSSVKATTPTFRTGTAGVSDIGFSGGVQGGYNFQYAPNGLFGIEADIGYLGVDRTLKDWNDAQSFGVQTDWFGTLRARYGYVSGPSVFYATGGVAFGRVENLYSLVPLSTESKTATGWTAGGGIETALGGNWSAKAEYLYVDLGHQDVQDVNGAAVFDNTFHVFRYGLNYKFGGPAVASALPAYNWSGFYAGVNSGIGSSESRMFRVEFPTNEEYLVGNGFTGGLQAGYNWQLNSMWVAGIEGDVGYLGAKGGHFDDWNDQSRSFHADPDFIATLRGRYGFSSGPALFYATGGVAFVNISDEFTSSGTTVKESKVFTGWTVGGGLEAALSQNWTAKAEYLYINAGHSDLVNIAFTNDPMRIENRFQVFRFGLNYKFATSR